MCSSGSELKLEAESSAEAGRHTMSSFNTVTVLLQMEAVQAHNGCIHVGS